MKPSHSTTPRSLSECHWQTGYTAHRSRETNPIGSVLLACAIGTLLALALVRWWAA